MKKYLLKSFFIAAIAISVAFTACNTDTTSPTTTVKPSAPTALMATSLDSNSIRIKWTPSTSESDTSFMNYSLVISPITSGVVSGVSITKSQNPYTVTNLMEGMVYTFTLKAMNKDGTMSDSSATVMWSPATRYNSTIDIYAYVSKKGSGLELPDANTTEPQCLDFTTEENWDLCLDTRNSIYEFGSPKASNYVDATTLLFSNGKSAREFDIYKVINNVSSLDDVYDTQGFTNGNTPEQKMVDFTSWNKGFVIIGKSEAGNFVKIFVKNDVSGNILQPSQTGNSNDKFISLEISYQHAKNIPYALINHGSKIVRNNSTK